MDNNAAVYLRVYKVVIADRITRFDELASQFIDKSILAAFNDVESVTIPKMLPDPPYAETPPTMLIAITAAIAAAVIFVFFICDSS